MERRIMLAADAGAALEAACATAEQPGAPAPQHTPVLTGSPIAGSLTSQQAAAAFSAPVLVIIDSEVAADFDFTAAVPENADLVLLEQGRDPIDQINQILSRRQNLTSLHLISHGQSGELLLGGRLIDAETLAARSNDLASWSQSFTKSADLLIYGCDVASGESGNRFVNRLARLTGLDVAASLDRTGAAEHSGNWQLETRIGSIEHETDLNREQLKYFVGTLSIQVYAAGDMGDEVMQLQIGEEVVQSWSMEGTDAASRLFGEFNVAIDNVAIDDIRINFINDLWDPAAGIDRNLRVDRIVVDGVTYQTEDPQVFSTGTWLPDDGIVPGYRQSEYLNGSGYLQYGSGTSGPSETTITIDATGETGQETMQLLIDGSIVQTYNNVASTPSTYVYSTNESVTADQIEIAFTNDLYDALSGIDRNLTVDRIRINDQTFETEAPTTYSTNNWIDGGGEQAGYFETETLLVNGSFRYLDNAEPPVTEPPVNGENGSFVLATDFASVFENQGSVSLTVSRVGGSEGRASVQYATGSESAIEGVDFVAASGMLFFETGETSKTINVGLLHDGVAEGTETFSFRLTGSDGASLLAPRTATIKIIDIDQPLPTYANFTWSGNLQTNGNAAIVDNQLQLTAAAPNQRGSAFYTSPINVDSETSFQAQFTAQFTGGQGSAGGEGLAFLIQNSAGGAAGQDFGNFAGGLGYNGQTNTIGIELDTFQNPYESYADEVTITVNGNMVAPVRTIQSPYDLNDGRLYYAWVDYNGQSNNLSVYLSDQNTKPDFALMTVNLALDAIVGDQAYLGFSAATGSAFNRSLIQSWVVTLDTPAENPPTIPSGQIVKNDLITGLNQALNVEWSPDGRNLYIGEKAGILSVSRDGGPITPLLDISGIVNNVQDRGLVDFEIHPDFDVTPYVYLNYTVDPAEVYDHVGDPFAGPDGSGNRAGRLIRLTLDASTNYTTILPDSGVTLLGANSTWENFNGFVDSTLNLNEPAAGRNPDGSYLQDFINSDSRSHTVGGLTFGGDGALYVGIGDGASFNATDVRALRVQDPNSLNGKILRIDPITGQGLPDNPFYDGNPDSNRSKVYQLGLRNPWRLSTDPQTGRIYIGETGLVSFEEINTGPAGTNFGWPFYEGSQGVNSRTPSYQNLPQAQAFYNSGATASPAFIAQPHTDGTDVIVLGSVAEGLYYGPQYDGDVFYLDFASGIVRHGNVDASGNLTSIGVFTTGANFVVDLQQGPDGLLYYVDIVSGSVGRFEII